MNDFLTDDNTTDAAADDAVTGSVAAESATEVAEATNVLTVGAPSASSGAAAAKAGGSCSAKGAKTGTLTCVKSKGKLVWKRR